MIFVVLYDAISNSHHWFSLIVGFYNRHEFGVGEILSGSKIF
jgi:hypothetical protein